MTLEFHKRHIYVGTDPDNKNSIGTTKTVVYTAESEEPMKRNPVADLERSLFRIATALAKIYREPQMLDLSCMTSAERVDVQRISQICLRADPLCLVHPMTQASEGDSTGAPTGDPGEWIGTIPKGFVGLFDSNDIVVAETWRKWGSSTTHTVKPWGESGR